MAMEVALVGITTGVGEDIIAPDSSALALWQLHYPRLAGAARRVL